MSDDLASWLSGFKELNPDEEPNEEVDKKAYKNDMFKEVLPALDRGDKNFYNTRTEEQQKDLEKNMWMIMRYMSQSKQNAVHHLMMVNDLVNCNFDALLRKANSGREGHPALQWKLLAMCGYGKSQFHEFIKPPRGLQKNKIEEAISDYYPELRYEEIELLIKKTSKEELMRFFKDNGYDDKTIKELFGKDGTKTGM